MGKKGCPLPDHKNHEPMDIVEMDELYTFVKKTLKTRVWTAVDRKKMYISAFEVSLGKASVKKIL